MSRNERYSGKRNGNGRSHNRTNGNGNGRRSNGNGNRNGSGNNSRRYAGGEQEDSNTPPVILPLDANSNEGLEFAAGWPSGQWAPAYLDARGILHRSYHFRDLFHFPALLRIGAEWYLSEDAEKVLELTAKDRDELFEFTELLQHAFPN